MLPKPHSPESAKPMLTCLHSRIRSGSVEDYRRAHSSIPGDLANALVNAGIRNWTIWRSGEDLFHLLDCDDFEQAFATLHSDGANVRWQATIGPLVEGFYGSSGEAGLGSLEQVWSLADQRSVDPEREQTFDDASKESMTGIE
jgi:L-rhamnose mutarotase